MSDLAIIEHEHEEEPPKRGTVAWMRLQEHTTWEGLEIPACHRIPEGASLYTGEDDGRCRVIRPGELGRCGATRVRVYGICTAHLGGGDPLAASKAGHARKAVLRERRILLGIGPNRVGNPRAHARMLALERAQEMAEALVDGPLDDSDLTSVERQQAVIRALDATYPLQSMTVEVELPTSAEDVSGMGWEAMQQLAARMLAEG